MGWIADSRPLRWFRGRSWLGRRVVLVVLALIVGWIVTGITLLVLLKYEFANNHEIFIGALVAWTGELIFFSIVGGVVSLVTLKDPTQAPFDERVRILYGTDNLPDAVTDYNKRMLSRLAGYASQAARHVSLEEYRSDIGAYRAKVRTEYLYKNLLPDVDYEATIPWRFMPDIIHSNPPIELGRIVSIKIGGKENINQPIIVDENGFFTELPLTMPRKGETTVVFEYFTWMAVGQPQTMHPRRFVEQFAMTIVNQCTQKPAQMSVERESSTIQLLYNQNYAFHTIQSAAPDETIFSFSLLSPQ